MDKQETVFVVEQGVPLELELDGLDPTCHHVLALDAAGRSVGTARMQPCGHIGRIAVLRPWRNRGVGSRLLAELLEVARRAGLESVELDAQVHAISFYEKHGFERAPADEKAALLRRYWSVPKRQIETSVVLAESGWLAGAGGGDSLG